MKRVIDKKIKGDLGVGGVLNYASETYMDVEESNQNNMTSYTMLSGFGGGLLLKGNISFPFFGFNSTRLLTGYQLNYSIVNQLTEVGNYSSSRFTVIQNTQYLYHSFMIGLKF